MPVTPTSQIVRGDRKNITVFKTAIQAGPPLKKISDNDAIISDEEAFHSADDEES